MRHVAARTENPRRPVAHPERIDRDLAPKTHLRSLAARYADAMLFTCPPNGGSQVEDAVGLRERGKGIAQRYKFVRDVPREARVGDGLGHGAIVQLLARVDFVASRNAAGVEVRDPGNAAADGADDVAFHDLHVI